MGLNFKFLKASAVADFTVSQLFNNEDDSFLGYSNMVCNILLSDSPIIINQIDDEFAMFIVWAVIGGPLRFSSTIMAFLGSQSQNFTTDRFTVDLLTASSSLNEDEAQHESLFEELKT